MPKGYHFSGRRGEVKDINLDFLQKGGLPFFVIIVVIRDGHMN